MIMSYEADLDAILREGKEKTAQDMLDERTIELISIAVSAAIRCSHCMRLHIRTASKLGVPDDQIAAAVFMAGNLCTASVLSSASSHLNEEPEICPICQLASKSSELQGEIKN